jgi:mannitol-1-phosphate 5-dehydrogenase
MEYGISTKSIEYICGAAFCYDYPEDPAAMKLQEVIRDQGVEVAVKEISGVDPSSELGNGIIESYYDLQERRKNWS